MTICSVHKVKSEWKEGISKKTNKSYAFWACPEMVNGNYCQAEQIEASEETKTQESSNDIRSSRIERQHSQEMALRFVDLLIKTDKLTGIDKKLSDLVKEYTEYFQNDLDSSSRAEEG